MAPTGVRTDAAPASQASSHAPRVDAGLAGPDLALDGLSAAWPGMTPTRPATASVPGGGVLAIVGRSGIGKTTLLLTLAGVLPPAAGTVRIGARAAHRDLVGHTVGMTAEDAHIFGTTVLENLRVARGDVTEAEARDALALVGLGAWVEGLPEGLDTVLGTGGNSVSGGERRRLLLARALLTPQPLVLIDEPAEHLDAAGREALDAVLGQLRAEGRTVVIVTHHLHLTDLADAVVTLDD
ncbi:hypothetical protein GCM10025876_05820 [Demequina litorisediminis]|uniref:ABC transporter domain-containing protein n=2 Tax=Demequina litorisediminis TaxID=1849022 RepID=A0ABQ6IB98_9MICO|nr:hypothetical protein GCM10025876_05820 [Demequina litorisediminis]